MNYVVTYLEMTAAEQLRPSSFPPEAIELRPERDTFLIRSIHDRVAAPHHWSSLKWSDDHWRTQLARPDLHHWIAWVDDEPCGLLVLRTPTNGDYEIDTFGLVPEWVGRRFGGPFLTLAVRIAWDKGATRIWLHTSSLDHPNAIHNYERRGFRPFRPETRDGDDA